MKILISVLVLFSLSIQIQGQQVFQQYTKLNGRLRYGNGSDKFLPFGYKGYTLIIPDKNNPPIGTIVMLDDDKIDLHDSTKSQYIHIDREANAEVRRVMVERYRHGEEVHGAAAFIRDAGAVRLDHDECYGTL